MPPPNVNNPKSTKDPSFPYSKYIELNVMDLLTVIVIFVYVRATINKNDCCRFRRVCTCLG